MMRYIDQLLQGAEVKWKKLGEIFETRNGYTPSKANADFWTNGTIPWYRMEDLRTKGRILEDSIQHITPQAIKGKGLFKAGSIILATTATIGEHALLIADSLANQQFTNFSIRKSLADSLIPKFIYYYFFVIDEWCKQNVNVSSFPSVDIERLKSVLFPIPPLHVQQEIVRILDKFTELETELEKELETELELRKQQYERYRDQLLAPDKGLAETEVKWKKLGEIARIKRGHRLVKRELSETGRYAVFQNSMTPLGFYDESNVCGDTTFIISAGAAGEIGYSSIDFWAADDVYYFILSTGISSKYLYYFLLTKQHAIKGQVRYASVPRLAKSSFERIPIPIPPLSEQQRIVSLLDKFHTLTTSISEGLPRELELRKQQYAYYRDQLLAFER